MAIVANIPARFAIRRLAGKALSHIPGQIPIERVHARASAARPIHRPPRATDAEVVVSVQGGRPLPGRASDRQDVERLRVLRPREKGRVA